MRFLGSLSHVEHDHGAQASIRVGRKVWGAIAILDRAPYMNVGQNAECVAEECHQSIVGLLHTMAIGQHLYEQPFPAIGIQ